MNAAADFVDANCEAGRGNRIAVVDVGSGAELSYSDVLRDVNRAGHALRRLGVRPEERVMILLPDCAEFVAAFFGTIKIGAVAVPVNTLLTPADYEYLLADSRARVLVVHERFVDRIEAIRGSLRHLDRVVVVGGDAGKHPQFSSLLAGEADALAAEPMHSDDAAFWLYSSGTTGFPKGAVHLQHDMRCCADSFAQGVLQMVPADRTFSVAKLFFAYGLGNALYFPFSVGASTILFPDKPDPSHVFEIVKRYRATVFYAVPTAYAAMLAAMDAGAEYDFSSVRLCSSAGEPLAASLYDRWRARTGVELLDGIGSTEVLHTFIANRAGRVRPGSSGEIVPGYEARIVDADGHDLPPGEIGDLLVKGESTCSCYWNKQEQTRKTIIGEWIRTGDKYSRDAEGYFWYQGRSDDMMKAGGYWVSPAEVEAAMVTHPAVLECAVVGVEDETRLTRPLAFVVLKTGAEASTELAAELQAHAKRQLAPYKCPRWVRFVDELPKTATGKIQRYKLRAAAATSVPWSAPGSPHTVT
jgi:benzoate-CoA ligase family protein